MNHKFDITIYIGDITLTRILYIDEEEICQQMKIREGEYAGLGYSDKEIRSFAIDDIINRKTKRSYAWKKVQP